MDPLHSLIKSEPFYCVQVLVTKKVQYAVKLLSQFLYPSREVFELLHNSETLFRQIVHTRDIIHPPQRSWQQFWGESTRGWNVQCMRLSSALTVQIPVVYFCFSTTTWTTMGSGKKATQRESKRTQSGRPTKKKRTDSVTDKLCKWVLRERSFNYAEVKNPVKGECRKYWISNDMVGQQLSCMKQITYPFPRMKNAFRTARRPLIAHALPRYDVLRSHELSSTKTS
jgi:hypothetical protein